tara:strand:+ start:116 stop:514 length:399 start_codon:yes stop_codon:yes gene_type:complete
MIFKFVIIFFDDLFQYHYLKLREKDSDPEIVPIALISLSQAANIFVILILLFNLFNFEKVFDFKVIVYSIGVIYFIFLGLNFYIMVLKGRRDFIINREKKLSKNFKKVSFIYNTLSFWLPLFLIYMFNEVWK